MPSVKKSYICDRRKRQHGDDESMGKPVCMTMKVQKVDEIEDELFRIESWGPADNESFGRLIFLTNVPPREGTEFRVYLEWAEDL